MDWSKAKSILIMALVATNIFLIANVARDLFYGEEYQLIGDDYINNVISHLKENEITIQGEIPREVYKLPILVVRYETFPPMETAAQILGEGYEAVGGNVFMKDDAQLVIESNKRLQYKNAAKNTVDYRIDDERAIELGNQFLKEKKLLRSDVSLSQVYLGTEKFYDDAPLYKLVYRQNYKNRFLGESYINVYVNHRGVVGMEAMLLQVEKVQSQKRRTIPAADALLRKMGDILADNKGSLVITEIEMGYYFDPYDIQYSNWKSIDTVTAFPTWKITLENGKSYYVEALRN